MAEIWTHAQNPLHGILVVEPQETDENHDTYYVINGDWYFQKCVDGKYRIMAPENEFIDVVKRCDIEHYSSDDYNETIHRYEELLKNRESQS